MYVSTPYGRVVALDPTTGKEKWVFPLPTGNPSTRGVEYFGGNAKVPPQIVFGSSDGKLYSLDAMTGEPNEAFGVKGVVDLNTPEILQGLPGNDGLSSPPIVYKNLIITGGRTQEGPAQGPAGDVRAWDVHDGKLVWTFHSVPRAGEPFNDTWAGDSWVKRSGVNVWGLMTVDTARGIVYMPFGAPATDRYGGDRPGDNLFSSSVVAADANTGKYLWHFQVVHHDIWDADVANPPILLDVKKDGKTIPAVGIMSKSGLVFLMDRVTGKSIYGVEERPVPQSEVPLERTAKTQPFPLKPAPLSRMTMTLADIATVTPELEAACRKLVDGVQLGGPYLPVGYNRLRLQFPGNHGGVNWGGASFNPGARLHVREHERVRAASGLCRSTHGRTAPHRPAPGRPVVAGATAIPSSRSSASRGTRARRRPRRGRRERPLRRRAGRRPVQGRSVEHDVPAAALGKPDGDRRQHRRIRLARAARRHRHAAAGEAEHRPPGQWRIDRHRRRSRLHRRDRRQPVPRVRREDRQGAVDGQARRRGPRGPQHLPGPRRQAVRRDHLDRRRLPRRADRRRQHHRIRAAGARR